MKKLWKQLPSSRPHLCKRVVADSMRSGIIIELLTVLMLYAKRDENGNKKNIEELSRVAKHAIVARTPNQCRILMKVSHEKQRAPNKFKNSIFFFVVVSEVCLNFCRFEREEERNARQQQQYGGDGGNLHPRDA